jgi:hypothetical protein
MMDPSHQMAKPDEEDTMKDTVGRRFPSVRGRALSGEPVHLPEDLLGAATLLFCAYRRGTQADIDRWVAFGRTQLPAGLRTLEVPIISGVVWRPLKGWIDGGMRGGVPKAQWSNVITVYDESARTARDFLGDAGGYAAHVVLLDTAGTVRLHEADGYAEPAARRLAEAIAELESAG